MGIMFDHSYMDTRNIVAFIDRIYSHTNRYPYIPQTSTTDSLPMEKLEFSLTNNLKDAVRKVQSQMTEKCSLIHVKRCGIKVMGSRFSKPKM